MDLQEAREIGRRKLQVDSALFENSLEQAKRMDVEKEHLPPMALALALLGASQAQTTDIGLQNELRDALNIVSQAESEWRMEQKLGRKARLS